MLFHFSTISPPLYFSTLGWRRIENSGSIEELTEEGRMGKIARISIFRGDIHYLERVRVNFVT